MYYIKNFFILILFVPVILVGEEINFNYQGSNIPLGVSKFELFENRLYFLAESQLFTSINSNNRIADKSYNLMAFDVNKKLTMVVFPNVKRDFLIDKKKRHIVTDYGDIYEFNGRKKNIQLPVKDNVQKMFQDNDYYFTYSENLLYKIDKVNLSIVDNLNLNISENEPLLFKVGRNILYYNKENNLVLLNNGFEVIKTIEFELEEIKNAYVSGSYFIYNDIDNIIHILDENLIEKDKLNFRKNGYQLLRSGENHRLFFKNDNYFSILHNDNPYIENGKNPALITGNLGIDKIKIEKANFNKNLKSIITHIIDYKFIVLDYNNQILIHDFSDNKSIKLNSISNISTPQRLVHFTDEKLIIGTRGRIGIFNKEGYEFEYISEKIGSTNIPATYNVPILYRKYGDKVYFNSVNDKSQLLLSFNPNNQNIDTVYSIKSNINKSETTLSIIDIAFRDNFIYVLVDNLDDNFLNKSLNIVKIDINSFQVINDFFIRSEEIYLTAKRIYFWNNELMILNYDYDQSSILSFNEKQTTLTVQNEFDFEATQNGLPNYSISANGRFVVGISKNQEIIVFDNLKKEQRNFLKLQSDFDEITSIDINNEGTIIYLGTQNSGAYFTYYGNSQLIEVPSNNRMNSSIYEDKLRRGMVFCVDINNDLESVTIIGGGNFIESIVLPNFIINSVNTAEEGIGVISYLSSDVITILDDYVVDELRVYDLMGRELEVEQLSTHQYKIKNTKERVIFSRISIGEKTYTEKYILER